MAPYGRKLTLGGARWWPPTRRARLDAALHRHQDRLDRVRGHTQQSATTRVYGHSLAQRRLPFPLLGVDSDNGSEFINDELFRYCMEEHLTFTRGRQGCKNDNAHVEQKNWSVVRRFVGDQRFDTLAQLKLLDQWYELLHSYVNFFLPIMKLQEKVRQGNKVKRIDDKPQTPCARVLARPDVSRKVKLHLRTVYKQLEVVDLKQQIDYVLDQLWNDANRS